MLVYFKQVLEGEATCNLNLQLLVRQILNVLEKLSLGGRVEKTMEEKKNTF